MKKNRLYRYVITGFFIIGESINLSNQPAA